MSNKVTKKFHAELLRVDDLLHLLVDGSNLRLSPDGNRGSFLSIEDPALPGYLRFTFAPQTIAETAVFEASIVAPESDPKRPDPDQTKNTPTEPLSTPGTRRALPGSDIQADSFSSCHQARRFRFPLTDCLTGPSFNSVSAASRRSATTRPPRRSRTRRRSGNLRSMRRRLSFLTGS